MNFWSQIEKELPSYLKDSELLSHMFDYLEQGVFRLNESTDGAKKEILCKLKQFFLFCELRGFLKKDEAVIFLENLESAQKKGVSGSLAKEVSENVENIIKCHHDRGDELGRITIKNAVDDCAVAINFWHQELERDDRLRKKFNTLEQLGLIDSLTELKNRRAFDKDIKNALALKERNEGKELSLVFVDIDFFKNINDTYGHVMGDLVLKQISCELEEGVRDGDTVFRYGGEEFTVICESSEAEVLGERLRSSIEGMTVDGIVDGIDVSGRITISVGVSSSINGDSPEKLVERADNALYKAKNSGRNCVFVNKNGKLTRYSE